MSTTRRYTLAASFYYDHVARELPAGTIVKEAGNRVTVDLDMAGYDSLRNDARYYVDYMTADAGFEYRDIVASAKRVLAALDKNPWPEAAGAEDAWDRAQR